MTTVSPTGSSNGSYPTAAGAPEPEMPTITSVWARPDDSDQHAPAAAALPAQLASPQDFGQPAYPQPGYLPAYPQPSDAYGQPSHPQAPMYPQAPAPYAAAPMYPPAPATAYPPVSVTGVTLMPAGSPPPQPMPAPTVATPVKRRGTANRLVDGMLVISLVVAAGGVGYAVGRQTAPASMSGSQGGRSLAGLGGGPSQAGGTAQGGATQVAAPSGAPTIPDATTLPGTGEQPDTTDAPGSAEQSVTGQAPANGGNRQQAGPGRGGFGRGGLSGTVASVDPTSITVTTADGQQLQVTTSDTTTYHQQVATTADAFAVGSPVRVQVAGGFGGRGGPSNGAQASPTTAETSAATEVELLAEAPVASTGGRGGRGGAVTGLVEAIDGSVLTVTTADGQSTQVATDEATSWVQQTVVPRDTIAAGANVRFTVEGGLGGGFGGGQGQAQGDATGSIAVSDVEVLLAGS